MKRWKMVGFLILLIVFCSFLNDRALAGLSEEQIKAFRSIKSVQIIVDQAYGETGGVRLPFEDVAQRILGYAGVKAVGADSKDYDATLKIEARGKAEGGIYSYPNSKDMFNPSTFYFTGADLSGTILLEAPGTPVYKKTFKGHVPTPFSIFGGPRNPSGAPFNEAFSQSGSFKAKILEAIGDLYGINPLAIALKDEDTDLREYAASILGEIKDSHAVEPLIEVLKDIIYMLEVVQHGHSGKLRIALLLSH